MADLAAAADLRALDEVRVAALGKKGCGHRAGEGLGALPPERRREAGPGVQRAQARGRGGPGRAPQGRAGARRRRRAARGRAARRHPAGRASAPRAASTRSARSRTRSSPIFADMGFAVAEGPDIEDDWHNFKALNIPPEHPARQMHDTFYLEAEAGRARRCCCAPTPARCRSAPWLRRQAAVPHHRARPHLPPRLRHDPHADVPPGRGPGDRPRHPHGPPEGLPDRLRARLLRARRRAGRASARATSRSPSPRPRWTSAAAARAAS